MIYQTLCTKYKTIKISDYNEDNISLNKTISPVMTGNWLFHSHDFFVTFQSSSHEIFCQAINSSGSIRKSAENFTVSPYFISQSMSATFCRCFVDWKLTEYSDFFFSCIENENSDSESLYF
jgi:hypothetical protein